MLKIYTKLAAVLALLLVLTSCAVTPEDSLSEKLSLRDDEIDVDIAVVPEVEAGVGTPAPTLERAGGAVVRPARNLPEAEIFLGTGELIDRSEARPGPPAPEREGDVTLNFEAADLREVIKFILGDLLDRNYLIDPQIGGQVTLQTSRPLAQEDLIPTLETLLQINGAALVRQDNLYRIVPAANAVQAVNRPALGNAAGEGYEVRIFPLDYVAAQEMQTILQPFLPPNSLVRVDPVRNLLIIAGVSRELQQLEETIEIFDVDFLEGMSVGLFRLENVEVGTIAGELERLFGETSGGPLAGMFRLIPIERLNAILVVTPQPAYLQKARTWIQRLDRADSPDVPQLFIYRMQFTRAEQAAEVLNQIFSGGAVSTALPDVGGAALAPGLEPVQMDEQGEVAPGVPSRPTAAPARTGGDGEQAIRIIADTANNALLVLATRRQYAIVEAAIEQLDISPLQVLVDATILEISLNGELRYGLQWFFKNNFDDKTGRGTLGFGDSSGIGPTFPGFNYSLVDSALQVRAVLSALAQESEVNILSSPSLMVLDNQSATIKVGDQVPIRTAEVTNLDDGGVTTTSIQYRDTGVSLTVTPRVNAGGMVVLEIDQEVNDVSNTTSSNIDSPTIQQRRIQSTVAVQSGESIVLGGLIREIRSGDESGVPVLYKVPVIGPLFGQTANSRRRTELIVLITPRVAQNQLQAREITEEFRRKLTRLPEMRSAAP